MDSITLELAERLRGFSPRVLEAVPSDEPKCPNGEEWRYRVSKPYIADGALENVTQCIKEGLVSSATRPLKEFENELTKYYDVPVAKGCNSGYSGLVICLMLAKVGPGDEVVIPSMTMIAVANAVSAVGATPVFADNAPDKLNPGLNELLVKFTVRTKAIIVTYTYGTTIDIMSVLDYCENNNVILIEDISEAIGTLCQGKLAGTYGAYAAASLYANKLISSGDGGFVLSTLSQERIYERAQSYTNHGFVSKYHFVHFERSGNYKMNGLAAALATPAVSKIGELAEQRNYIAREYRKHLHDIPGVTLMEVSDYGPDAPWCSVLCVNPEN